MDWAVRIRGITKVFPRVTANRDVTLDIALGSVHALVGENGAGKSTLMNILYGLARPDAGAIEVEGTALPLASGFLGLAYGIGMIHQHFMLIGQFTVLENIILGSEPRTGPFLDRRAARERVEGLIAQYGIEIDLARRVDDLSVGEEQRVEILKVLYRDARIIIMDEPTAVLTPQEATKLFGTMRTLAVSGRTVIFITHKLEEVMEVADAVTVMRAGAVVATRPIGETDTARLAEMMVGRRLEEMRPRAAQPRAEPLLEVRGVSLTSRKGQCLLTDVSLVVNRGEIFGICGVEGNGQDELFEVLIGLRQPGRGRIMLDGADITAESAASRLEAGLAHIPPDRIRMGLIGEMSVEENLLLGRHREPRFTGVVLLKREAITREAARQVEEFGVEPPDLKMRVSLLSGGNQQKVVAARELGRDPKLLIAAQPTRGLDIGAARLIHELLVRQADQGKGVLLVSADLGEVMSLSDRIGVMYRGRIVGTVPRTAATKEALGLMMAGARPGPAPGDAARQGGGTP